MIYLPKPLDYSKITVTNDLNKVILTWRNPSGGFGRYAIALFLLVWLGGWAVGEWYAISSISREFSFFLMIWLIGWTLGGIFAFWSIIKLLMPFKPEKLILDLNSLSFQEGDAYYNNDKGNVDRTISFKRKKFQVEKIKIENIKLERVSARQRLTLDYGAKTIEIGKFLTEPEREWLYQVLSYWKSR